MPGSLDPLGPVTITARDIYDAVIETRGQVGRLVDQVATMANDLADHEARLRRLEDVRPGPRISELYERVRGIEARLFPLPVLAVLLAAASLGVAIFAQGR